MNEPLYRGEALFFQKYEDLRQKKLIQEAHAHAQAVWLLADYSVPADIRELAKRWGMEQTIIEMWRRGFIEGWRAAHKETE